ncbi:type II toxin-antitoxin system RelE/ParE family toxin [Candidatus Peregrinibacteria bacterium]|nr:type II toxin-antitoxin system RelE/ParE family toxin [Candidatus Peregrinibacteria bacterium]
MTYELKTSKNFEKDFACLDSVTQSRVLVALEKMRLNPLLNAKKLHNMDIGIFRQRIGDYRLRYDILGKDVFLYRIRHRKEVYRG